MDVDKMNESELREALRDMNMKSGREICQHCVRVSGENSGLEFYVEQQQKIIDNLRNRLCIADAK